MGRIPEDIVEDVLARTDILQVVEQYVSLKRAGSNHKGLCPFHDENTPSFNVSPSRGIFKCFGCGLGGNAFKFLMEIEGWNFPETVRHLAERAGVEIPEESDEEAEEAKKRRRARQLYRDIMASARSFYEEYLWDPDAEGSARARAYLQDRGINEETAKSFGMGYAPEGWQNLLDHFQDNGVHGALIERAGLAIARRGGSGHYDRFRDRIMFPVIDIWGHTLAFGGRVLPDDDAPKYINSSETRFYTKGRHLFGLHAAKQAIQKSGWALLVEGNFDVIALHAFGIKEAVAPMGTAFTERQAKLLKRYASKVIVAFDGDDAGEEATVRCLDGLEAAGVEGYVIRFEDGDDPDTFVRREGKEALEQKIAEAVPLVGWALDRVIPSGGQGPIEDRVKALERAAEIMDIVREPIVWKHYAEELARRLDIEARLFKKYLKRPQKVAEKVQRELIGADGEENPAIELETKEFVLLTLLLKHPHWLREFLEEDLQNLLRSQELAELLEFIWEHVDKDAQELDAAVLLERLPDERWYDTVSNAIVSSTNDIITDDIADAIELGADDRDVQMYEDVIRRLKIAWADRSIRQVSARLDELSNDYTNHRDAYVEANKQLRQLEKFRARQLDARPT